MTIFEWIVIVHRRHNFWLTQVLPSPIPEIRLISSLKDKTPNLTNKIYPSPSTKSSTLKDLWVFIRQGFWKQPRWVLKTISFQTMPQATTLTWWNLDSVYFRTRSEERMKRQPTLALLRTCSNDRPSTYINKLSCRLMRKTTSTTTRSQTNNLTRLVLVL